MSSIKIFTLVAVILFSLFHQQAHAQTSTDVDESFDPFSDYNEFEQDADEEADINFFKNGRMLTLGLQLGYRGYTDGFSQGYTPAVVYGFQFTYFFDLQTALGINYINGDNNVAFNSYNDAAMKDVSVAYSGSVNIQAIDLSFKYYFNTENVTRGLADLNPYMSLGAAYFIRTYSLSQQLEIDPDKVYGLKTSIGIEVPLLRRRAFLGFQATYYYVQFPDENKGFIEETKNTGTSTSTAQSPISPHLNGDPFDISAIIGINF
jgi:hypothetical protein